MSHSAEEHAVGGKIYWSKFHVCFQEEFVFGQWHLQHSSQAFIVGIWNSSHAQNEEVGFYWNPFFENWFPSCYFEFPVFFSDLRLGFIVVAYEYNSLVRCFAVIIFSKSEGAHVLVQDVDICVRTEFLDFEGVFDGLTAAYS